jgi:hypothetical protein
MKGDEEGVKDEEGDEYDGEWIMRDKEGTSYD